MGVLAAQTALVVGSCIVEDMVFKAVDSSQPGESPEGGADPDAQNGSAPGQDGGASDEQDGAPQPGQDGAASGAGQGGTETGGQGGTETGGQGGTETGGQGGTETGGQGGTGTGGQGGGTQTGGSGGSFQDASHVDADAASVDASVPQSGAGGTGAVVPGFPPDARVPFCEFLDLISPNEDCTRRVEDVSPEWLAQPEMTMTQVDGVESCPPFSAIAPLFVAPMTWYAWYYDDPDNPTKVITCPSSCQSIKAGIALGKFVYACNGELVPGSPMTYSSKAGK